MVFDFNKFVVPLQDSLEDMINECEIEPIQIAKPIKRMRKRFIRPMDLEWFLRARAISPMGAVMACFLWYRYGLERTSTIKAFRGNSSGRTMARTSPRTR